MKIEDCKVGQIVYFLINPKRKPHEIFKVLKDTVWTRPVDRTDKRDIIICRKIYPCILTLEKPKNLEPDFQHCYNLMVRCVDSLYDEEKENKEIFEEYRKECRGE